MWANDHDEQYPMAVSSVKGGAREAALSGDPVPVFVIASNEMISPKPLLCPSDKARGPRPAVFEGLAAKNVSYLVGIDASETNVYSILVADRNVVLPGEDQPTGLLTIASWQAAQWSPKIHNQQGNIALADGSAWQTTQRSLEKALGNTGLATNRFAVP